MFVIVAIVLLVLLPSPWNFIGFVASLVAFCGEVLFWNRRVRRQRVATGVDTLVGTTGVVVSPCRPNGQVQLRGEIWEARCDAGADRGDTVAVLAVDRLTLVVERRAGPGA